MMLTFFLSTGFSGLAEMASDNFQDIIAFSKQMLLPNVNVQHMKKGCLISGLVNLTVVIALNIFSTLPLATNYVLTAFVAVPLFGAVTGIPLFVYVGSALAPISAFFLTALTFSALGIGKGP